MRDKFDRGSKWLIEHHGDSILRLAGITGVESWKSIVSELVQPKQLPDGLLEVCLIEDPTVPAPDLLEIATFAEFRLIEQATRDPMLVFLDRHVLPDVITIILRPKGNLRISGRQLLMSQGRTTRLDFSWRVVELWDVPAEELLAANDVGLVPWIPLTRFDDPPESVLAECRRRIEAQAPRDQQENLLVVAQVFAGLRYNNVDLLKLLGGRQLMIESPLIQELVEELVDERLRKAVAGNQHSTIELVLEDRFGTMPPDLIGALHLVQDVNELKQLAVAAARCTNLNDFRSRLPS